MEGQATTPAPGEAEARELMLDQVAKMLGRRSTPAEIGHAIGKEYRVPPADRPAAIAAGLARLVGWVGVPQSDPRFDSLALCESVVRSHASVRERMAAQQWIDELRAEAAPQAAAPSDGGELAGMTDEQLESHILRLQAGGAAG